MEFKEKVRLHNTGEYNLVDELLDLALADPVKTEMISYEKTYDFWNIGSGDYQITFTRWRPKYSPLNDSIEYRLAYNFKVIFSRHNKPANSKRKTHYFEGDKHDIHEFDALGMIYETLKAVGHEYYKDDLDKVTEEVLDDVAKKFGSGHFYEFHSELVEFQTISKIINREKQKYNNEIRPLMEQALNYMLSMVDLNKTDDEIVGYIAKGVRNGTYKRLDQLYGVRTFNRDGERYFLKENNLILHGAEDLIKCKKPNPTKSQKLFIEHLTELINEEIVNRNSHLFFFDKEGKLIDFNKRYFANKMNMSEDNFKHKLRRLQQV